MLLRKLSKKVKFEFKLLKIKKVADKQKTNKISNSEDYKPCFIHVTLKYNLRTTSIRICDKNIVKK